MSCTKREGNTLSIAVRTFWDGGDYSPLTKTNPVHVKGAHICILTHITKSELDALFSTVNMANGFGKAFNAFPPGWEKDFGPLRDLHNIREGWTRPDDPERARFCAPSHTDIAEARRIRWGGSPTRSEKEDARAQINAYLKARMETGSVRDRADVLTALREAGLDINREGKDYITVKDPDSGEKIRMKGGILWSRLET